MLAPSPPDTVPPCPEKAPRAGYHWALRWVWRRAYPVSRGGRHPRKRRVFIAPENAGAFGVLAYALFPGLRVSVVDAIARAVGGRATEEVISRWVSRGNAAPWAIEWLLAEWAGRRERLDAAAAELRERLEAPSRNAGFTGGSVRARKREREAREEARRAELARVGATGIEGDREEEEERKARSRAYFREWRARRKLLREAPEEAPMGEGRGAARLARQLGRPI